MHGRLLIIMLFGKLLSIWCSADIIRTFSNANKKGIPVIQIFVLSQVDSLQPVEFLVAIENFLKCQGCIVSLQDVGVIRSMMMDDTRGSPLQLKVTTEVLGGGAMKVYV